MELSKRKSLSYGKACPSLSSQSRKGAETLLLKISNILLIMTLAKGTEGLTFVVTGRPKDTQSKYTGDFQ